MRNFSFKVCSLSVSYGRKRRLRILQSSFWLRTIIIFRRASSNWICSAQSWMPFVINSSWANSSLVCFQVNFIARNTPFLDNSTKVTNRSLMKFTRLIVFVDRLLCSYELLIELLLVNRRSFYWNDTRLLTIFITCHLWSRRMHLRSLGVIWKIDYSHWVFNLEISLFHKRSYVLRWNHLVNFLDRGLIVKLSR
jgi:hypothetical protein